MSPPSACARDPALSGDCDPGSALDVDPAREQILHLVVFYGHDTGPGRGREGQAGGI